MVVLQVKKKVITINKLVIKLKSRKKYNTIIYYFIVIVKTSNQPFNHRSMEVSNI